MVGIKYESMRKGQTSHKKEHNTRMCFPLKPVFTRDKGGLPNFIDEPTAGLDVMSRNEMLDMLRDYMEEDEEQLKILDPQYLIRIKKNLTNTHVLQIRNNFIWRIIRRS